MPPTTVYTHATFKCTCACSECEVSLFFLSFLVLRPLSLSFSGSRESEKLQGERDNRYFDYELAASGWFMNHFWARAKQRTRGWESEAILFALSPIFCAALRFKNDFCAIFLWVVRVHARALQVRFRSRRGEARLEKNRVVELCPARKENVILCSNEDYSSKKMFNTFFLKK